MKVLITGSSGMIGAALAESLVANGHEVIRLRRQKLTDDSPVWEPENGVIDLAHVRGITSVVHLAGENVAKGRWNSQKKGRILHSRVMGTKLLADFFAAADHKPDLFVSASAIGVYGNRGEQLMDESSEPGSGYMADVCKQWEAATASASNAGIRVANVRVGVVLSTAGGALKTILPPFKMGLGGVFGTGKQYMSWVSLDDVVGMIQYVIARNSLQGPINLVAPKAVSNREFTKTLGRALHRPTIVPLPAFVARMAFGEMADELLLASTRVLPKKLIDSGYQFLHPELEEAFEKML